MLHAISALLTLYTKFIALKARRCSIDLTAAQILFASLHPKYAAMLRHEASVTTARGFKPRHYKMCKKISANGRATVPMKY